MGIIGKDDQLVSLFVVNRHSIRAPIYYPEGNSFIDRSLFPRGGSYLTETGIKRSVAVGKIWKRWYPSLITGNAREVWARSSENYRCAETAQALLHGMYCSKYSYQPIAVIVPPPDQDKYISSNSLSDEELFTYLQGYHNYTIPVKNDGLITVNDVLEFVKVQMNIEHATDYDMFIFLDGLISLAYDKLSQPSWYLNNRKIIDYTYNVLYARAAAMLRPYYGHYLMEGLAERMASVMKGNVKYGTKLSIFSYHDFSISAILNGLDERFSELRAHFLAGIFFEMYQRRTDGSFYFKILWSEGLRDNGSYSERKPLLLSWANNTNKVEFDRLYDRLNNNIYKEYMLSKKRALKGYTQKDAMV